MNLTKEIKKKMFANVFGGKDDPKIRRPPFDFMLFIYSLYTTKFTVLIYN